MGCHGFWMFTLLWAAVPAWAQTTGQLRVSVSGSDLATGIPNVELRLASGTLIGGPRVRYTEDNGQFLYRELPPGTYQIEASRTGYCGVTITGIRIEVGRTAPLQVALSSRSSAPRAGESKAAEVSSGCGLGRSPARLRAPRRRQISAR